jgi:hypothetical protein
MDTILIKNAKNLARLALLILLPLCLAACSKYTDLNNKKPYVEAVGKKFVLQQDYYIFRIHSGVHLYIGDYFALPRQVEQKNIGFKNNDINILGIAKAGQIIQIDKFFEKTATISGSFNFLYVSLLVGSSSKCHELDATGLMNMMKNPPFTTTWSDPPIFDAKYALPLPSDGVWWK